MLIVSNEETARLATDAAVVSVDTVPELRLWTEEEEEEYGAYLDELGVEALAKLALFDAATEETGIRFTERATLRRRASTGSSLRARTAASMRRSSARTGALRRITLALP